MTETADSYRIFVPVAGGDAAHIIDTGSGIVGQPNGERFVVHFESNRYQDDNMGRYADRVHQALGRAMENYPTTAQMAARADDVIDVGYFDNTFGVVRIEPQHVELVAAYCGAVLDTQQLTSGSVRHQAVRELSTLAAVDPIRARFVSRVSAPYRAAAKTLGLAN